MVELSKRPGAVQTVSFLSYMQCAENPGIYPMDNNLTKTFFKHIQKLSLIIEEDKDLEEKWQIFCDAIIPGHRNIA